MFRLTKLLLASACNFAISKSVVDAAGKDGKDGFFVTKLVSNPGTSIGAVAHAT
jgi:hypothetical protein